MGTPTNWAPTIRTVAQRIADDRITGRAAQMSFYLVLSAFPTLLILMSALGAVLESESRVQAELLARVGSVAPDSIVQLLEGLLDHLARNSQGLLTWGIVVALWAASTGMVATMRGLNHAYAVAEERPWWRIRLGGLVLTLAMIVLMATAMLLLAYGVTLAESIGRAVGFGPAFVLVWQVAQWPLIVGFVLLALNLLYHFAPNRRVRWRWLRPGTVLALGCWLLASAGLKFYAATFTQVNVAYGSIGAVILLLLWVYLTNIAVLVGAEVNATLEHAPIGRDRAASAAGA